MEAWLAHVSRCPHLPFLMQVRNCGSCPVQQCLGQLQNLHSMRLPAHGSNLAAREPVINPGIRRNYTSPNSSTETPKHGHARYGAATVAQETCQQDLSRRVCGLCRVAPSQGQSPGSSTSTGGSNSGCPGGRPPAVKARDSRLGHLDAVLCYLYSSHRIQEPCLTPGFNGLYDNHCKSQPEVRLAVMGGL